MSSATPRLLASARALRIPGAAPCCCSRSAVPNAVAGPSQSLFVGQHRALHGSTTTGLEVAAEQNNTPEKDTDVTQPERAQGREVRNSDEINGSIASSSRSALSKSPAPANRAFNFRDVPRVPIPHHPQLVAKVRLSSYGTHLSNLTFFGQFAQHAAYAFNIPCTGLASLPVKTSLRTVPRSPFVHKPSQENFVKKQHFREIRLYNSDVENVEAFLNTLGQNGMDGVSIKVEMFEYMPLGFGKDMLRGGPELDQSSADKVKQMAQGLLDSGFGTEERDNVDRAATSSA